MIAALVKATVSLVGELLTLLLQFIADNPRAALVIGGIALFAILVASIAYFWLLVVGLLLLGAGAALRQQGA